MILRRLTENLRAQNWTAITIEFVIVVIGVFVGTQVSNWNQERLEKVATSKMLDQLRPEIQNQFEFFNSARIYYRTTRPYAEQALAGWAGDPQISDNQFVIAAYQASQIYGIGINAQNWALTFGGKEAAGFGEPFEVLDVPWALELASGQLIHAAYWHDRFGIEHGAGSFALSPADAARLFRFIGPELPRGWHAVTADGPAAPVVIRR